MHVYTYNINTRSLIDPVLHHDRCCSTSYCTTRLTTLPLHLRTELSYLLHEAACKFVKLVFSRLRAPALSRFRSFVLFSFACAFSQTVLMEIYLDVFSQKDDCPNFVILAELASLGVHTLYSNQDGDCLWDATLKAGGRKLHNVLSRFLQGPVTGWPLMQVALDCSV